MANVSVYNKEGKEIDTLELNDAVFGVEVNEHLVHMAVVAQLANNRQVLRKQKTRSEVSGGGRKHGDRKELVMQDRFNKSSTVDWRWNGIRSNTKRLYNQTEQEREESCSEICINKQSKREQVHRC